MKSWADETKQWFEEALINLLLALAEQFLVKIQGKHRQFGDSSVIRTVQGLENILFYRIFDE